MTDGALYPYSFAHAQRNGEAELWRESHRQNILCADAVEKAIKANFDGAEPPPQAAERLIAEYGFPRLSWVLANTARYLENEGSLSTSNQEWADGFFMEPDRVNGVDMGRDFIIKSPPAAVDSFIDLVRQSYQDMGMLDQSHCHPLSDVDITGQVAVLKLSALKLKYQHPDFQLFIPDGGFGCSPTAIGRRVYGTFLKDGDRGSFYRQDFVGVLKPEQMPEWARERLAELRAGDSQEIEQSMT